MAIRVAILTASDRCSQGVARDASGPALKKLVEAQGWEVVRSVIVADDEGKIKETLLGFCGEPLSLVLTTGGTGLGPRDVTPEATRKVIDKELAGLAEWMRIEGAKTTLRSLLSRAVVGARGECLIVNLPGSPQAAVDSLNAILGLVPHALAMLKGAGHAEIA